MNTGEKMAYISFEKIEKYYGSQHVLKNLSLSVEKGEFVTLLGSSGCGKSTLLRCLAGLESISSGRILLDGEEITHVPPRQRNVGMIFQQYSLFPTMNVYNNIAFGLKIQGVTKEEAKIRITEALKMVDLAGSEQKYPSQLSGGEQQRVALCRCIVTKPKVLLMDEPFSAIDAKLRKALQKRIKEIHRELGMTTIFVTHDQDEAMSMSDTIHLMNQGIVEQSAEPLDLYAHPGTAFAASFMGNYNMVSAAQFQAVTGDKWKQDVCIRPELIEIFADSVEDSEKRKGGYTLSGTVTERIPQGNTVLYYVTVSDQQFKVSRLFNSSVFFEEGQKVCLFIPRDAVLQYEKEV